MLRLRKALSRQYQLCTLGYPRVLRYLIPNHTTYLSTVSEQQAYCDISRTDRESSHGNHNSSYTEGGITQPQLTPF